jgi:hypothetical protein
VEGIDRKRIAQEMYAAFAAADRDFVEEHLSDDFTFSAPPDPLRGRNTEVLSFDGEKISRAEVYFGWNVEEE